MADVSAGASDAGALISDAGAQPFDAGVRAFDAGAQKRICPAVAFLARPSPVVLFQPKIFSLI